MENLVKYILLVWSFGQCFALAPPDYPQCRAFQREERIRHYTEAGCSPYFSAKFFGCRLIGFNCSSVFKPLTGCMHDGKIIPNGSPIPSEGVSCDRCSCTSDTGSSMQCVDTPCANYETPKGQVCEMVSFPAECCETQVCNQKDRDEHKANYAKEFPKYAGVTCKAFDKTYKGGEIISGFPGRPCRHCICSSSFDGPDSEFCYDKTCGQPLDKIKKGCSPIYEDTGSCCPSSWQCPSKPATSFYEKPWVCTYEGKSYAPGRIADIGVPNTSCICEVPPLLTCIKSSSFTAQVDTQ